MTDVIAELRSFLGANLPDGWADAVEAGDEERLRRLRDGLDNRAFVQRLGAAGWVAPHWAVPHGGLGVDRAAAHAVLAELDRWDVPRIPRGSGLPLAAPTILEWSSEATKRRFLPKIVTGEERWCQLFSEPGAGSDLASLATSAVRDGDEWVVNGQKVWTTFGHESEFAMLLARTDPTVPKHQGITYFGLDMRLPGVEVRPLVQMTGEVEFNEVFLSDVRIPDLYRISPTGEGWAATNTTLSAERYALAGGPRKRKASDEILGGKTIDEVLQLANATGAAADPVRRDRVTREYIRSRVLALTIQRSRAAADTGQAAGPAGSLTKIAKAAANQSLQVLAIELLGAHGQAWDAADAMVPGFVREFLRTRANSIEGGTSEIQRNIVGERILGLPREPDPFKGRPWNEVPRS
ncbi:MAG: acyl-CoA dehydrogenase family protein [Acidimicrobiales bacterium]